MAITPSQNQQRDHPLERHAPWRLGCFIHERGDPNAASVIVKRLPLASQVMVVTRVEAVDGVAISDRAR
jgi:hypothetical protein